MLYNNFGQRLKELRLQKRMTQKELAEAINVNFPMINKWEVGKGRLLCKDLIKLAHFFDVKTDYLLGAEDYSMIPQIIAICKKYT